MARIKESFIRCSHCSTKFRSPFFIGDTKTFSHAILWGNRAKCPFCEITTDCNERNMSYVLEEASLSADGRIEPVPMREHPTDVLKLLRQKEFLGIRDAARPVASIPVEEW